MLFFKTRLENVVPSGGLAGERPGLHRNLENAACLALFGLCTLTWWNLHSPASEQDRGLPTAPASRHFTCSKYGTNVSGPKTLGLLQTDFKKEWDTKNHSGIMCHT